MKTKMSSKRAVLIPSRVSVDGKHYETATGSADSEKLKTVIDEAASALRVLMLDCDELCSASLDFGERRAWMAVKNRIKSIEIDLVQGMRIYTRIEDAERTGR